MATDMCLETSLDTRLEQRRKRMLVVSDNPTMARTIEVVAGEEWVVAKAVLPNQDRRDKPEEYGCPDLIVVALSSTASEPIVALAQAQAICHVGQVPVLIISDRQFDSDPDTRIAFLDFPFSVDELGDRLAAMLHA